MSTFAGQQPHFRSGMGFASTQWSKVIALKATDEAAQLDALSALCRTYWFPLYAFARHRGMTRHDAEDAVQGFFAYTGDAEFFRKAVAEKGKLRTFILTAFTRHLTDLYRREGAQKRGGHAQLVSIDHDQVEEWLLADKKSTDETLNFERLWAKNILRTVIGRLEAKAEASSEEFQRFRVFSRFLNPETCHNYTIKQAAEDLGITYASCEKAISRLRQTFRLAVREQVASTLENPTDETILEEMKELQKALSS
jgi:DNA-directed RNA polymerase specialized sigma24 family protein